MSKILLTGMSGVGKSTVLKALCSPNTICVDLDESMWMVTDQDTGKRCIAVPELLSWLKQQDAQNVVLAGCESNQGGLYPYLDSVIVMTAPLEVMRSRILERANPYGKSENEWRQIQEDVLNVEPLLKKRCSCVCNTDKPVAKVLDEIRLFLD